MDNLHRYLTSESGYLNPITNQAISGLNEDVTLDISYLSEQLHASLDINRVLQTFSDEAACFVQLSGIRFQCESLCVETKQFLQGIYEHITEISLEGKTLGYLTYAAYREIGPKEAKILHHMQSKLVLPLRNALQFNLLQQQAMKDHLTNLGNRASFDEQFELAIERANKNQNGISLILLDLDHFKLANDTFGHAEGDRVLQEFAQLIKLSVRRTDVAFRFGGDEFAIILDSVDQDIASKVALRVQNLMSCSNLMEKTAVSCSIGFATWQPDETSKQLFRRADHALYQAKFNGRNQLKRA